MVIVYEFIWVGWIQALALENIIAEKKRVDNKLPLVTWPGRLLSINSKSDEFG